MKGSRALFTLLGTLIALSACSGIERQGQQFTVHAESFNLLTLQIPGDDYAAAMKLVPAGSEIHTVYSNPSDLESFWGVINRILGIGVTQVSGASK